MPFAYIHRIFPGPQSQLDAMKLNRLHAATMAPSPSHVRTREEKGADVRSHQRARRSNSDDYGRPKSALSENRITTIPEITESFERRLCLRNKKAVSAVSCCVEAVLSPCNAAPLVAATWLSLQQKPWLVSVKVSGFPKVFCWLFHRYKTHCVFFSDRGVSGQQSYFWFVFAMAVCLWEDVSVCTDQEGRFLRIPAGCACAAVDGHNILVVFYFYF